jgi:hypothetical protein
MQIPSGSMNQPQDRVLYIVLCQLCMQTNKDCTLTYRRLTSFLASFAYLGFLDTMLSSGLFFFQYLGFLGTGLPLGQDSIKLDFRLSKLLFTLFELKGE